MKRNPVYAIDQTLRLIASSPSSATLLHSSGEFRSDRGRRRQPDLCRRWVPDAVRPLAAWLGRRAFGGRSARRTDAHRKERPAVDGRASDGHVHVRGVVRTWKH